LSVQLLERVGKLRAEQAEVAFNALGAANHHMVGAGNSVVRDDLPSERAEASFYPVAYDRTADLFCDSEANAHLRIRVLAITDKQDKTRSGGAQAAVRGNEISALADRD